MSAVVASFSGQNADTNSSVNSLQDAKHIFPDLNSCRKMRLVKLAACLPLKYDRA
jgi:hypothetical protein